MLQAVAPDPKVQRQPVERSLWKADWRVVLGDGDTFLTSSHTISPSLSLPVGWALGVHLDRLLVMGLMLLSAGRGPASSGCSQHNQPADGTEMLSESGGQFLPGALGAPTCSGRGPALQGHVRLPVVVSLPMPLAPVWSCAPFLVLEPFAEHQPSEETFELAVLEAKSESPGWHCPAYPKLQTES